MIVIVNGAFGVGKTTVANLLRAKLRNTAVFDPERIGYVPRRLRAFVPLPTKKLATVSAYTLRVLVNVIADGWRMSEWACSKL